jgi:hypothetical protein
MGAELLADVDLPPAFQALTGFKWAKVEAPRLTRRFLWSAGYDDPRTGKRVMLHSRQSLATEAEARQELYAALEEALR